MGEAVIVDSGPAVGGDVVRPASTTLLMVKVIDRQTELIVRTVFDTLLLREPIVHQCPPVDEGVLLHYWEV